MRRPAILVIIGAGLVATAGLVRLARPGGRVAVDFVDALPGASARQPAPEAFAAVTATLAGDQRRAIAVDGPSRLAFRIRVPPRAWLAVGLGQLEDAWTTEGDGVLFLVGLSDATRYHELLRLVVDPYGHPGDRRWQDYWIDLAPWADREVDLIFNTRASPPDRPGTDTRADRPVWGAPRLVTR